MSAEQSFLVVSTGCLSTFENNSRTKFKNKLAKPARASKPWVNSLYLDVEQINFEYTPVYYENNEADFLHDEVYGETFYKIPRCYTIEDLVFYLRHAVVSGYIHSQSENGVKITVQAWYPILIHSKFAKFLNINTQLQLSEKPDYYHLNASVEYTSSSPVMLNYGAINYVDLFCEEITPYFCDNEFKKIISRINVADKKEETIHLDTLIRRYYKIESTTLETITFELKQPNGMRLLMEEGPPTIIKAKFKEMESNSDFFYLQVNSKDTESFPKNNASAFTAELPNEIELKGEWEVALTHAELPTTEGIFTEDIRLYPVKGKAEISFIFVEGEFGEKLLEKYNILLLDGGILTIESFLETINNFQDDRNLTNFHVYLDENGTPKIFTKYPNRRIFMTLSPKDFSDFVFPTEENTGVVKRKLEDLAYVYRNVTQDPPFTPFQDLINYLKHNNSEDVTHCYEIATMKGRGHLISSKFLFTFEKYYKNEATLKVKEDRKKHKEIATVESISRKSPLEEKALLEIHEKRTGEKYRSKTLPTWMFLYTDFVKPTLIADCYSNVLKLIPYKQNAITNGRFYTFTPLDFFTVNKDILKTLSFELRTHAGEKHDFRNKKKFTSLTLFFRKIKT